MAAVLKRLAGLALALLLGLPPASADAVIGGGDRPINSGTARIGQQAVEPAILLSHFAFTRLAFPVIRSVKPLEVDGDRRRLLRGGLFAAVGTLIPSGLFAQETAGTGVDLKKVRGAVLGAVTQQSAGGLGAFGAAEYWTTRGLTPAEAGAAADLFNRTLSDVMRRVRSVSPQTLPPLIMGLAIGIRLAAEDIGTQAFERPDVALSALLQGYVPLLKQELQLWAASGRKPDTFLIADILEDAFARAGSRGIIFRDAWRALFEEINLAKIAGPQDAALAVGFNHFRNAVFDAGYLIESSVASVPRKPAYYDLEIDVLERLETPVEPVVLDDTQADMIRFKPLIMPHVTEARTIRMAGRAPFVALIDGPAQIMAQMYVDIRDGRPNPIIAQLPAAWRTPTFRRFLQRSLSRQTVAAIAALLERASGIHELVHLWRFNGRRHRLRDAATHFGLSAAEWTAFHRLDAAATYNSESRIAEELIAYTGSLALEDEPLLDLIKLSALEDRGRAASVEGIVADVLIRSVAGKMGESASGKAAALSRALFEQRTPVTPASVLAWIDALLESAPTEAERQALNDRIRQAARSWYADMFVNEDGAPAELPARPQGLARVLPAGAPSPALKAA